MKNTNEHYVDTEPCLCGRELALCRVCGMCEICCTCEEFNQEENLEKKDEEPDDY